MATKPPGADYWLPYSPQRQYIPWNMYTVLFYFVLVWFYHQFFVYLYDLFTYILQHCFNVTWAIQFVCLFTHILQHCFNAIGAIWFVWLIHPYPSTLLQCHWGNLICMTYSPISFNIASMPLGQSNLYDLLTYNLQHWVNATGAIYPSGIEAMLKDMGEQMI